MKKLQELIKKVHSWAKDKGLNDFTAQIIKLDEERVELSKAIYDGDREAIIDEAGDNIVVCFVMSHILKTDISIKHLAHPYKIQALDVKYFYNDSLRYFSSISKERWIYLEDYLYLISCVLKTIDSSFEEALEKTYLKISKRKGKTVNGVFVKE